MVPIAVPLSCLKTDLSCSKMLFLRTHSAYSINSINYIISTLENWTSGEKRYAKANTKKNCQKDELQNRKSSKSKLSESYCSAISKHRIYM